jgi:hypothetical protein
LPKPVRGKRLCVLNGFNDVLIEPFVPDRAIIALDIGILLRFAGLDMVRRNALFFSPCYQLSTDIFRAIVHAYS